jgi:RHS repeat-associated protein
VRTYVWGSDLSGSLQGAGGVGGLLKVTCVGTGTTNAFVAHDGNGNVAALLDAANGNVCARYEYGPFAEATRVSGPLAKVVPVRFSTKYVDDESGLCYYGYRYFAPTTGRWLTRDPLRNSPARGFGASLRRGLLPRDWLNLYACVANAPVDSVDNLGLATVCGCSQSHAHSIASGMAAYYIDTTREVNLEYGGKICCKLCSGYVYSGTVVYGEWTVVYGTLLQTLPMANSKCDPGDKIIALWHTHPPGSPRQVGDSGVSPDLDLLRALESSDQACKGVLSYMMNEYGRLTILDPTGHEHMDD